MASEHTPLTPGGQAPPPKNCLCFNMSDAGSSTLTALFFVGVLAAFGGAGLMMGLPLLGLYVLIGFLPPFALLYGCYCLNTQYGLSLPLVNAMYILGFCGALPLSFLEYGITLLVGIIMPKGDDTAEQLAVQLAAAALNSFFVAGFTEETFKYVMAKSQYRNAARLSSRSPGRSIVMIAFAASLGFATLENMMYVGFSQSALVAVFTGIARACISIPLHSATGCLIGVGLVKKLIFEQGLTYWHICFFPVLIHGSFDFFLMASTAFTPLWQWAMFVGFGLAGIMMIVAITACSRSVVLMTREEVRRGSAIATGYDPTANAPPAYVSHEAPPPYAGGGYGVPTAATVPGSGAATASYGTVATPAPSAPPQ